MNDLSGFRHGEPLPPQWRAGDCIRYGSEPSTLVQFNTMFSEADRRAIAFVFSPPARYRRARVWSWVLGTVNLVWVGMAAQEAFSFTVGRPLSLTALGIALVGGLFTGAAWATYDERWHDYCSRRKRILAAWAQGVAADSVIVPPND